MVEIKQEILKKFLDKNVALKLNGGRRVTGLLRGIDSFSNAVLEDCIDETKGGEKHAIGMVVIRGKSIELIEALDWIKPSL